MLARSFHLCVSRWLTALSLVAYASVGVFGHALHDLLPCGEESCVSSQVATAEHHCSCCHHHSAARAAVADARSHGPQVSRPGHDPDQCSLCTLLAKIKVGRVALYRAELTFAHSYHESASSSVALPASLDLIGAPRGPPLA